MATTARRARERSFLDDWRRLGALADRRHAREFLADLVRCFGANNLLTFASAIAWQVLVALVPLTLAGLAVAGFLDLQEIWRTELAPQVQENVSPAAFSVIDTTVERILGGKRTFWLTFGLAFAIWQVSGAVRAIMGALNAIYRAEEDRSLVRRLLVSLGLATVVTVCLGLAVASIQLGDRLARRVDGGVALDALALVVRWGLALLLMAVVIGVLIRYAPAASQPASWVGFATVLVVGSWVAASLVFGWYATSVADYGSIFGSLAVVIVLMTYLYLSAVTFLAGVQVDALLRERATGSPAGDRG